MSICYVIVLELYAARHVDTAQWRLPIYHYDDYEGWDSKIMVIRDGRQGWIWKKERQP